LIVVGISFRSDNPFFVTRRGLFCCWLWGKGGRRWIGVGW
jgi:hypothetical protein